MANPNKKRVFLGVNHATATDAEARCLLDLGFEVFVPKKNTKRLLVGGLSVTITDKYDASLSIPQKDLDILNNFNFYDDRPTKEMITLINRYFHIILFTSSVGFFYWVQVFKGACILRAYGHLGTTNYEKHFQDIPRAIFSNPLTEFFYKVLKLIQKITKRCPLPGASSFSRSMFACWINRRHVFLGAAFEAIASNEPAFFKNRSIFLPLGIPQKIWSRQNTWQGGVQKIMFVCSNVEHPYYANIFALFMTNMGDMPHTVFGRQGLDIFNPSIRGFISQEEFEKALGSYACMFYHSTELRHLHYHPVEAVVFGMPLIFMKGGLLEYLGGPDQPGMAGSYKEAREKLQRILDGDTAFIKTILQEQPKIIESLRHEHILAEWKRNFRVKSEGGLL